jgi:hypothetical protein
VVTSTGSKSIGPLSIAAAACAGIAILVALLLTPQEIRPGPLGIVVWSVSYFVVAGVIAILHRQLLRPPNPLGLNFATFALSAAVALVLAVVGLQISFALAGEMDAPVAVLVIALWLLGCLALVSAVLSRVILGSSFAGSLAVTAIACGAVALAFIALPLLGVGR